MSQFLDWHFYGDAVDVETGGRILAAGGGNRTQIKRIEDCRHINVKALIALPGKDTSAVRETVNGVLYQLPGKAYS